MEGIGQRPHTAVEFDGDDGGSSSSGHGFQGGQQLGTSLWEASDGVGGLGRRKREGGSVGVLPASLPRNMLR